MAPLDFRSQLLHRFASHAAGLGGCGAAPRQRSTAAPEFAHLPISDCARPARPGNEPLSRDAGGAVSGPPSGSPAPRHAGLDLRSVDDE